MKNKLINAGIFIVLCFVWGSSFILMKEGMRALTAYQVAAIRMLTAGLVLLPVTIREFRHIPRHKLGIVLLSGLLGSFFPAFLFCIAETRIDSSIAGFLNALTPIFTLITGLLFFQMSAGRQKIFGVTIGFAGMLVLFLARPVSNPGYIAYSAFVILAAICYGINVNIVGRYLRDIRSYRIVAIAFAMLIVPASLILLFTGYFSLQLSGRPVMFSTGAAVLLGIGGSAFASILFYVLLKRAGGLYASMVTYGVPFVALFWGMMAGELINGWQIAGLLIILAGVYTANLKK